MPRFAADYAGVSIRTLRRDLAEAARDGLLTVIDGQYSIDLSVVMGFLPGSASQEALEI